VYRDEIKETKLTESDRQMKRSTETAVASGDIQSANTKLTATIKLTII